MSLLIEIKQNSVFDSGLIGLSVSGAICSMFIICQLKLVMNWYYFKILRP
jgi:hypothetical protein